MTDLPERIAVKISVDKNDCWIWTGKVKKPTVKRRYGQFPYGMVWWDGKMRLAHRVIYTLLRGKIPYGLELDHLCGMPQCVNPFHMEPVTRQENVRRSNAGIHSALKTSCPKGHVYNDKNTYFDKKGYRQCRQCKREWMSRQRVSVS